jgi:hypothetical protein
MDKADAFNFRLGMLAADVLASRTIMAGVLTQEKMADGFGILLGVPVAGPNTDNAHATMEGISLSGPSAHGQKRTEALLGMPSAS